MQKPPLGAGTQGRPRRGRYNLLEVKIALSRLKLLLFADVLPDPILVQTHRADTVPRSSKVQSGHPSFPQQLSVNP